MVINYIFKKVLNIFLKFLLELSFEKVSFKLLLTHILDSNVLFPFLFNRTIDASAENVVKYINVAYFVGISIILTTCFSFYMKKLFFNDLCFYFCILLFELVLIYQTTWGSLYTTTFKFESLVFRKMGSYSSYWEIFSIFTIFEKRLFKTSVVFILVFTSSQFSVKFILLLLYDALENKDFTTL